MTHHSILVTSHNIWFANCKQATHKSMVKCSKKSKFISLFIHEKEERVSQRDVHVDDVTSWRETKRKILQMQMMSNDVLIAKKDVQSFTNKEFKNSRIFKTIIFPMFYFADFLPTQRNSQKFTLSLRLWQPILLRLSYCYSIFIVFSIEELECKLLRHEL